MAIPVSKNATYQQFIGCSVQPPCSKTSKRETSKKATISLEKYLAAARNELTRSDRNGQRYELTLSASAEAVRWFVLPQEISLPHSSTTLTMWLDPVDNSDIGNTPP